MLTRIHLDVSEWRNYMNNSIKMEAYDKFSCTADQCPFTCCRGWKIAVDSDTYHKWDCDTEQLLSFPPNVKAKKNGKKTEYSIKMKSDQFCPFLDEKGLCSVVINYGEDFIPKTCRVFPRQENHFDQWDEYSLSCTCPAVVDLLCNSNKKTEFRYEGTEINPDNAPPEYLIRDAMITKLQNEKATLKDRLLLIFFMLLELKDEPVITKEILSKYEEERNLESTAGIWGGIPVDEGDSCMETNELFLDMVCNYRKEKGYLEYLKEISKTAEALDVPNSLAEWKEYKAAFGRYDLLMENCMVSKIFANCISDDLDEIMVSFQIMITEYVLIRYSSFLKRSLTGQRKRL
jgi:lysine-N-methylase